MATFDSIFPTFLAKCGELHTLLLSVAFALFVTGIIVTVHHRFSHRIAQVNIGHNTKAMARAYSRNAPVEMPALSEYEKRNQATARTEVTA